jgi:hypothetical protein
MSDKLGAAHPTRYSDKQWVALEHEALKRGCKVCDVLRAFADSLDEQQEREFRLLARRFFINVNNVNSVHDKEDMR